jgi:hypothetical protein
MTTTSSGFSAPLAFGGFVALIALVGLLVLWYDSPKHVRWRRLVDRVSRRLVGAEGYDWVDARLLAAISAAAFTAGAAVTWALGGYGCTPTGPSDAATLVSSGRAFLHGGDPFIIAACGLADNPVPAGAASVLLDGLGSIAGTVGVLVVWGAVSVALPVLVADVAGPCGRAAGAFVLASFVYLPIVAVQVDGASLAIVPVTVLLVIVLARRGWVRAAAVGGFLATGRFPALFPVAAGTGRAPGKRLAALTAAVGTFGAVTAATFAAYGSRFSGPVFLLQITRSHFALNYWGILEGEGWLTPSTSVAAVQAALTVALVGVCWARSRTDIGGAAIVLVGVVLLAQYLSFTELVFLVPVALLGARARWWLWGIGVVAAANYLLAMRSLANVGGPFVLSYVLDAALTVLLAGLMVDLARSELGGRGAPAGPAAASPTPAT